MTLTKGHDLKIYRNDVFWSENGGRLVATKMLMQTRFGGFENHTKMATVLRDIFYDSQLPGFVYHPTFMLVCPSISSRSDGKTGLGR